MAKLKIFSDIVNEEQKLQIAAERKGQPTGVCYQDVQAFIDAMPEDDNNIEVRIHCCGGDCCEGWAIYDALRRSGKTITAIIEGECSSIASVILLAAPSDRRYGTKNMRMCIHNPSYDYPNTDFPKRYTPDKLDALIADLEIQTKALREEQDRILDLYVERTGSNRKALQSLMDKDTYIDASRAQELGFISHILVPTTAHRSRNQNTKTKNNKDKMAKPNSKTETKPSAFAGFLAKIGIARPKAQVITAADGSEFTVEREDGDPQVGDVAYPSANYVLDDGTTVVIDGDVITDIIAPESESAPQPEETPADPLASLNDPDEVRALIAELQGRLQELDPDASPEENVPQVEELQQTISELRQTIEEQTTELEAARPMIDKVNKAGGMPWLDAALNMRSTFTPQNRRFVSHGAPAGKGQEATESKTQKAIRERREAAAAKREKRNS